MTIEWSARAWTENEAAVSATETGWVVCAWSTADAAASAAETDWPRTDWSTADWSATDWSTTDWSTTESGWIARAPTDWSAGGWNDWQPPQREWQPPQRPRQRQQRTTRAVASAAVSSGAAASAADANADEVLQIDPLWAKWDKEQLNQFEYPPGVAPQPSKPSLRINSVGKAFANYRRSMKTLLKKMRMIRRLFSWWRVSAQIDRLLKRAKDSSAEEKSAAESAAEHLLEASNYLLWTDEDMHHFLFTKGSFAEHKRIHEERAKERLDSNHKHHGKDLPKLIPPSLIRLHQISVMQSHSTFYYKHFGEMNPSRLFTVPLEVLADNAGLEMPESVSYARIVNFEKDWEANMKDAANHPLTGDSNAVHMRGAKLWTATLAASIKPRSNWKLRSSIQIEFQKILEDAIQKSRLGAAGSVVDQGAASSADTSDAASASVSRAVNVGLPLVILDAPRVEPALNEELPVAAVRTPLQTWQDVCEGLNIKSGNDALDEAVQELESRESTMANMADSADVHVLSQLVAAESAAVPVLDLGFRMDALRKYVELRFATVLAPFKRWIEETVKENPPLSVDFFGSATYQLALATSDYDIVLVLQAGRNGIDTLSDIWEGAKQDGRFTRVLATFKRTSTLQMKFCDVWVDVTYAKVSRSANSACATSDLLKLMMEQRSHKAGFVLGVLTFKLLAHHLNFLHKHMKAKGEKFKAITLCFWAVAVFDRLPQGAADSAADPHGAIDSAADPQGAADSAADRFASDWLDSAAAETLLQNLLTAFKTFSWSKLQVFVAKDGTTRITEKTMSADVVVFLEAPDSNSGANVTLQHVQACIDKLASLDVAEALEHAIWDQDLNNKTFRMTNRADEANMSPRAKDAAPEVDVPQRDASAPEAVGAVASAADFGAAASAADSALAIKMPMPLRAETTPSAYPYTVPPPPPPIPLRVKSPPREKTRPPLPPQHIGPPTTPKMPHRQIGPPPPTPAQTTSQILASQTALPIAPATVSVAASATVSVAASATAWPNASLLRPMPDNSSLPKELSRGTFHVKGTDGNAHEFVVTAGPEVTQQSSVLVLLPGAGGARKNSELPLGKAPKPVWEISFNVGGKFKVRTPSYLRVFLKILREEWTASHKNKIFLLGFSRGAAWIVDLALEDAKLFDAVIALAPYPWTKHPDENKHEARQLMQVTVPVLLVHFDADEFCNSVSYPNWFAQLSLAMESPVGNAYGLRQASFNSWMVPGNHDLAWKTFKSLAFEDLNHDYISGWWHGLWAM